MTRGAAVLTGQLGRAALDRHPGPRCGELSFSLERRELEWSARSLQLSLKLGLLYGEALGTIRQTQEDPNSSIILPPEYLHYNTIKGTIRIAKNASAKW